GLRDLGYASTFFPKITAIGTPFDQMAVQAVRWLSNESSRPSEGDPLTVWLPPQLRPGGSTLPGTDGEPDPHPLFAPTFGVKPDGKATHHYPSGQTGLIDGQGQV
ncbi:MAG: hypothetical protein IH870_05960, partial [Chloroflexi bacterium]|nr:hypothetical protein [Chloroflexota bacterium]